jgi:hypothetical protein
VARFDKSFRLQSPVGPVYRVNGAKVRKVDPDGIGGWHRAPYPRLVPGNEIWIEKLVGGADEERKILAHEMTEILLMKVRRWKYQRAHDAANRVERALRKGRPPAKVFASFMKRHFPRATDAAEIMIGTAMLEAYEAYR